MIKKIEEYLSKSKHENMVNPHKWKDRLIVLGHEGNNLTRIVHSYQINNIVYLYEKNKQKNSTLLVFDLGKVIYSDLNNFSN